jgi:hypothetical protein
MIKSALLGVLGISLTAAVAAGSCGGGSSAGDKFCHDYATALCHKIYACPDPHVTLDRTEAQCASSLAELCITDTPPPGITSDVSCAGGKHVNTAAAALCLNEYGPSLSCEDFNKSNFLDSCPDVCGSSPSGAAGNSGGAAGQSGNPFPGTAGDGGGTAGSSGGTAGHAGTAGSAGGTAGSAGGTAGSAGGSYTRMSFCTGLVQSTCDFLFRCVPVAARDVSFTTKFGTTVTECESTTHQGATCLQDLTVGCTTFTAADAKSCVADINATACADAGSIGSIPSCNTACQ